MVLTRDVEPNTHLGLMGQNVSLERSVIPGGLCLVVLFPWAQAQHISQNYLALMPVVWGTSLSGGRPKQLNVFKAWWCLGHL